MLILLVSSSVMFAALQYYITCIGAEHQLDPLLPLIGVLHDASQVFDNSSIGIHINSARAPIGQYTT